MKLTSRKVVTALILLIFLKLCILPQLFILFEYVLSLKFPLENYTLPSEPLTKTNDTIIPPKTIPHIIHQTFKTSNESVIPSHWLRARNSCKEVHPDYKFMFWTDEDIIELIKNNYAWFLDEYLAYPYHIQRVDAARYFILHKYGGVYMDLDIGCVRRMDKIFDIDGIDGILPKTAPVGVSNDWMAFSSNHPFMDFVIHRLSQRNCYMWAPYLTVFLTTGPAFLTAALSRYSQGRVGILVSRFYSDHSSDDMFFYHSVGNSWHQSDVIFYKWLYQNLFKLAVGGGTVLFVLFYIRFQLGKQRKPIINQ